VTGEGFSRISTGPRAAEFCYPSKLMSSCIQSARFVGFLVLGYDFPSEFPILATFAEFAPIEFHPLQ